MKRQPPSVGDGVDEGGVDEGGAVSPRVSEAEFSKAESPKAGLSAPKCRRRSRRRRGHQPPSVGDGVNEGGVASPRVSKAESTKAESPAPECWRRSRRRRSRQPPSVGGGVEVVAGRDGNVGDCGRIAHVLGSTIDSLVPLSLDNFFLSADQQMSA